MIVDRHHGTPNQKTKMRYNRRVVTRTSVEKILEFPGTRPGGPRVPKQARQFTNDDIELSSLKLIRHLCNVSCQPLTRWPSNCYGQR